MSKNKFNLTTKKPKESKKQYDPSDVDMSLRFKPEKKRQKPNNWKKYLETVEEDEQYG